MTFLYMIFSLIIVSFFPEKGVQIVNNINNLLDADFEGFLLWLIGLAIAFVVDALLSS